MASEALKTELLLKHSIHFRMAQNILRVHDVKEANKTIEFYITNLLPEIFELTFKIVFLEISILNMVDTLVAATALFKCISFCAEVWQFKNFLGFLSIYLIYLPGSRPYKGIAFLYFGQFYGCLVLIRCNNYFRHLVIRNALLLLYSRTAHYFLS